MKLGVVQIRPFAGDIQANIQRHEQLIHLAISDGAELVVFPELSITGYEPTLANELAVNEDDHRFDVFQSISNSHDVAIGIGAPTRNEEGICISLILFQPGEARQVYSKMHLHVSEEPFFVSGSKSTNLIGKEEKVALAICYELSVPEHAANASKNGAEIYLASVADSAQDIDRVLTRLGAIAQEYSMMVLISNYVGSFYGLEAAGRTSAWNKQGALLSQLDDANEGIIVVDTETQHVATRQVT